MHSPSPLKESHVSSPGAGARSDAVAAARSGAVDSWEQDADDVNTSEDTTGDEVAIAKSAAAPSAALAAIVHEQEPAAPLPSIDEVVEDAVAAPVVAPVEDVASVVAGEGSPPRKRLERVCASWVGEDTVMTVSPGEFVLVWADSTTEQGWIYADHISDASRFGWLPTFVFETLPQHQRWMKVTDSSEAEHETQLEVRQGSVLKVSTHTRTEEGWAYAEHACVGEEEATLAGWVPVFCLAWTEE